MLGIGLALLSAVLWAMLDAQRKVLSRSLSPQAAVVFVCAGAAVLFGLGLLWSPPTAWPPGRFWAALLGSATLNLVANLLFFRAVQHSPLSLTIPYLSFTPVFMLLSGALWLGEWPRWLAVCGVFTVMLGAILLNPHKEGRFAPLKALLHERGSLYMLCVAFLWSNTGPFEKIAIQSGPLPLLCVGVNLFMALPLAAFLLLTKPQELKEGLRHLPQSLGASLTMTLATLTQLLAFRLLYVAYVDTIKRSGAIFAVLIGYFFFKERPLRPRLLGASIMVSGVLLVIWGR